MRPTLRLEGPLDHCETAGRSADPPELYVAVLSPITVDPVDGHDCYTCGRPLTGPWGYQVAVSVVLADERLSGGELTCPNLACACEAVQEQAGS